MSEDINLSTKDKPGDYDAIETAKPGEPLFPIQGGDPLGPPCVQFWADEARSLARRIMSGEEAGFQPGDGDEVYHPSEMDKRQAKKLLEKATQAEQVKWAMEAYQRGEVVVEAVTANVAANPLEGLHKWQSALLSGCRHLREAAYHLTNAIEHLPEDQAAELARVVKRVNRMAANYEPKRASYPDKPDLPTGEKP
jgi:hypothetical protein